ncbi:MAG: protoheme IX farnesyltransferase [Verrucomicrobia bacterium]|nr:protoheme IX farnesyltransferase [Verrucomicrobiota bacterium]
MKMTAAVLPMTSTRWASRAMDFCELTKPRLNTMVLLTTAAGFYLAAGAATDWTRLLHAMAGTFLAAGGAAALNMALEREVDGRMARTRERPVPAGRVTVAEATLFGGVLLAAGVTWLALAVNALAALLAALTAAVYLLAYTPLKRKSALCTLVGAVSGATPPMIGWAAAHGELAAGAWALFGIMFLWQLPHFMAIAWMHREDYARAGLPMLPVVDAVGAKTVTVVLASIAMLTAVSLVPALVGVAGMAYGVGAMLLGAAFLNAGLRLARERSVLAARRLFFGSLIYLPLLMSLMMWNKNGG